MKTSGIATRFRFRLMVINATFNNITVISWRSVLLEETEGPGENQTCGMLLTNFYDTRFYRVHLAMDGVRTHNFSGDML